MKKSILFLLLFSVVLGHVFSEENVVIETEVLKTKRSEDYKNQAYIGIGTPSLIGMLSGTFYAIADAIDQADKDEEDKEATILSLNAGYNRLFLKHIGLGGFFNYEKMGKLNLFSLQGKLSAQYGWEHFKFYHAISGGVLFLGDSQPLPMYDITVLGLKLDFEEVSFFLEGCFPSTALIKIGVVYNF